jgi:hypothetical protein
MGGQRQNPMRWLRIDLWDAVIFAVVCGVALFVMHRAGLLFGGRKAFYLPFALAGSVVVGRHILIKSPPQVWARKPVEYSVPTLGLLGLGLTLAGFGGLVLVTLGTTGEPAILAVGAGAVLVGAGCLWASSRQPRQ